MTEPPQNSLLPVFEGLQRSRRGRTALATLRKGLAWLLIIGIPGALGWVGAKLDVKSDVAELRKADAMKAAEIRILHDHVATQAKLIDTYDTKLIPLANDIQTTARAVVQARQMAVAYENPTTRKRKIEAGRDIGGAFDRILADKKTSVTGAIEQTWAQIAVP
jgi:hypothetical protein